MMIPTNAYKPTDPTQGGSAKSVVPLSDLIVIDVSVGTHVSGANEATFKEKAVEVINKGSQDFSRLGVELIRVFNKVKYVVLKSFGLAILGAGAGAVGGLFVAGPVGAAIGAIALGIFAFVFYTIFQLVEVDDDDKNNKFPMKIFSKQN
jgi:hypothetical protein